MAAFLYGRFMRKNDLGYDGIAGAAARWITAESRVLELACGTGQLTGRLAHLAKEWTATDYSAQMVAQTRKAVAGGNLTFEVADATQLSCGEGSFDIVLIANALHVMPMPGAALAEILRVLKPGGTLIAPTFVQGSRSAPFSIWLMKRTGLLFHPWTAQEYVNFIARRGFSIVESPLISGRPLDECLVIGKKPAAGCGEVSGGNCSAGIPPE